MSKTSIISLTPYQDINDVLVQLSQEMRVLLSKNFVGLYLFGFLSYGDFNLGSSDIDLVAVVRKPLDAYELERIKQFHKKIGGLNIKWFDRLECSYTPLSMFTEILPPVEPRPYYGGGVFYDEASRFFINTLKLSRFLFIITSHWISNSKLSH